MSFKVPVQLCADVSVIGKAPFQARMALSRSEKSEVEEEVVIDFRNEEEGERRRRREFCVFSRNDVPNFGYFGIVGDDYEMGEGTLEFSRIHVRVGENGGLRGVLTGLKSIKGKPIIQP